MSSAIDRAFQVLECFASYQKPLRLADVVSEIALPKQTAHRLIMQLLSMGLLEKDLIPEHYRLGVRARRLGLATIVSQNYMTSIHSILEDLVASFEETVNVGVLENDEVLYIDRVECHWPLRVQLASGSRVKIHCTAIGKLLLAYSPEPHRDSVIKNLKLEQYTSSTITDPDLLRQECEKIRAQGYSENTGEDLLGLVALAVPIVDAYGTVVAGIAVHAPEARMDLAKMRANLDRLRSAAEKIAAELTVHIAAD